MDLQTIMQFQEINCIVNTVGPRLTELLLLFFAYVLSELKTYRA